MKTLYSPIRALLGMTLLVGFSVVGAPTVKAQQYQCTSGTCPNAGYSTQYQTAATTRYTYQYQTAATTRYAYQYQAAAPPQYTYQYQAAAPTQYTYQYQAAAAAQYTYQYQAAAPAQYQYQQAAGTVQYQSYYHSAGAGSRGGSDPYGFLSWLNSTRASYGLSPVGYDANLESWASANNGQQQSRGLGHYVMGSARRQNSAVGSYSSIGSMWMNSPAHRAALLDPSITRIGLAGSGSYWTFNAN